MTAPFPVKDIDQALMNELFTYAETAKTGRLFWKVNRGGTAKAGTRAGGLGDEGYRLVKVNNILYKEHRAIYTMLKGEIPEGKVINHLDENKSNNRIDNLEAVWPIDNTNWGTRNARSAAANSKPIFCHENGVKYPSSKEAAEKLNLDATNISKVLNNKRKRTKGKTFSFVTTPTTTTV